MRTTGKILFWSAVATLAIPVAIPVAIWAAIVATLADKSLNGDEAL